MQSVVLPESHQTVRLLGQKPAIVFATAEEHPVQQEQIPHYAML